MESRFGTCDCGASLDPVWFTEEEYITNNGQRTKTGRTRKAVSHLECPNCLRNHCVDDSFDLKFR